MNEWAAIDIADALELLSPDFKNHDVRAHAVATLQVRTYTTRLVTVLADAAVTASAAAAAC